MANKTMTLQITMGYSEVVNIRMA